MRVDELVDGILVGIGDRDTGLAIKDAHVTDGVHAAEVGDERTVDALELEGTEKVPFGVMVV